VKRLIILALVACAATSACAADDWARFASGTPRGGVIRFTGDLMGDPVLEAQKHCREYGLDAVPLGFFPSGNARERLMTFECKK
jgi:hypothetical protein